MPYLAAALRRIAACCAGTTLCLALSTSTGQPVARAEARELLASGGHLMVIKAASQRLEPHLLVDSHRGYQARCERNPRARTSDGLMQASETYTAVQAWQALGQPTIAINANFFDVRGQKGGSWRSTGCSSPLGTSTSV